MDYRIVLTFFPIFMLLMIMYVILEMTKTTIKIRGTKDWALSYSALLLYSILDIHLTEYNYILGGFFSSLFYIIAFIFLQYSLSNYLEVKRKFTFTMLVAAAMALYLPAHLIFNFDDGYWLNIIYSVVMILIIAETVIFIRIFSTKKGLNRIFTPLCVSLVLLIPYFIGRILSDYDFGVNHIYALGTFHSYLYLMNLSLLASITLGINYIYRWFYIKSLQSLNEELDLKVKEVTNLSETDLLTNIPNRRKIESIIYDKVEQIKITGEFQPFSVILLDLDNFKLINDNYGHQKGDTVLISFATMITQVLINKQDACGRWGGDEFIIFLPDLSEIEAESIAIELLKLASKIDISRNFNLSFSYGIKAYEPNLSYDDFFKNLDSKLYKYKNNEHISTPKESE